MPPAGIVILGIVISQASLIGLAVSLATTIISGVLQVVLAKKPKSGAIAVENRTITVKQPISPWQKIVGSARVGGTVFFLDRDGNDVWIGIVWASHECRAIDSHYADEEQIFVNADGSAQGTRSGQIFVYDHLGDPDQTYDTAAAAVFPLKWTENHRGRGRCYSFHRLVNVATNWDNAIPNLTADIRGGLLTDSRTGLEVFTDNAVQNLRAFLLDGDLGIDEDAVRLDSANFNAESNICDEEVAIPEWSEHWKIEEGPDTFTVSSTTNDNLDIAGLSQSQALTKYPNGTAVTLTTTGTLPNPLAPSTTYYISQAGASPNDGQLYTNEADALAGTNRIDITTTGTGTHTIAKASIFRMLGRETTFTVNTGTDAVTVADVLNSVSDAVMVFKSTGTLPAPLTTGTKYRGYVGSGSFLLSEYLTGGVNFTTTGSGTHTLRLLNETELYIPSNVSGANNTITVDPTHLTPRYAGRAVQVVLSGGPAITGVNDRQTVFLIPISDTLIQLAENRSAAEAGIAIDIAAGGSGSFYLEALGSNPEECLAATTGTVVRVGVAPGGGSVPTGLSTNTDYYLIRRGRGRFQLATSLANALAGIAIQITDAGTHASLTYKITLKRERRFTANGAFSSETDKREVLKWFASAIGMGAILEPLGTAKWRVRCGVYRVPLGHLGIEDIRGGAVPEIQTKLPLQETANTIKGTYSSPLNHDQLSDFPAVSDRTFVEKDGGRELVQDIQLPLTNSKTMARRIATSWLKRKRLQRSIRWPATLPAGFRWEYGDGLCVTFTLMGYDQKTFQVENWEFQASSESGGTPIPQVDLILREMNPLVWR